MDIKKTDIRSVGSTKVPASAHDHHRSQRIIVRQEAGHLLAFHKSYQAVFPLVLRSAVSEIHSVPTAPLYCTQGDLKL